MLTQRTRGSVIRGDEQAALSYPSKTSEVCREFLGDYTAYVFIVSSSGRRNREGTMTRPLELVCDADSDLVQHQVDTIVTVVPVHHCTFRILVQKEIDKTVLKSYSNGNRSWIPGNPFPSLKVNEVPGRAEIRNPKIICAKAVGKSAEVLFRLHDHLLCTGGM